METELDQILKLIESIKDNGNNSAAKVREVLTAMAMFSNSNSGEGFEIKPEGLITTDTQKYFYSFKGIKGHCCNAYLLLSNSSKEQIPPATTHVPNNTAVTAGGTFNIEVSEEEYKILLDFIPETQEDKMYLLFTIPTAATITSQQSKIMMVLLAKETDEKKGAVKYFIKIATNLGPSEGTTTSIALNFKDFVITEGKTDEEIKKARESVKVDTDALLRNLRTTKTTENIKQ